MPWTDAGSRRASRAVFERAAPVFRGQRVREVVELALEHAVELVDRPLDAVVGEPVLREVVGADLLGPLARADLGAPRCRDRLLLPRPLELVQARTQHAKRLGAVLDLGLLVLHR